MHRELIGVLDRLTVLHKRKQGSLVSGGLSTNVLLALPAGRHNELLDLMMGFQPKRRRLTSPIQRAVVGALVQATTAAARSRGDVEEGPPLGIIAFILWFLDDVMKMVLGALIIMSIAYLLKWPAAAATPQRGEGFPRFAGRWAAMHTHAVGGSGHRGQLSGFPFDWLKIESLKELCSRHRLLTPGMKNKTELPARLAISLRFAYRLLKKGPAAAATPQHSEGVPAASRSSWRHRLWRSKSAASRSIGCRFRSKLRELCRRDGFLTAGMKTELRARLESSSRWALVDHTPS